MYLGNQTLLVNDALNLLRGKLVRFILEDGDMRMIANLVATADELGLEYDQKSMTYRDRKAEEARSKGRAQLAKELEPGLNALFGKAYTRYGESVFDDDENREAQRQERNRKARERYHAKKKGKTNGSKTRKTNSRKKGGVSQRGRADGNL
tara:strand:+ start:3554 stop:4006 length:453 start_codon:yes stop_codon:yes gene_type:complete